MHNNQQPRPNSEAVAASFGIPHCGAILAGEAAAGEDLTGGRETAAPGSVLGESRAAAIWEGRASQPTLSSAFFLASHPR